MLDSTPSYRCKVTDGNTLGTLRLGRQSFKVDVLEMSRDSFSVRIPARIAKKVAVGSKSRLFYQEMLWSVRCTNKWMGNSNSVDLEFQQLDELTPPKLKRGPMTGTSKPVAALGQSDPILPVAMLGAFILAILILPAWGGQWGTSDAICGAISNTWSAVRELVTGKS